MLPASKTERLSGWGRASLAACRSFRPEKRRELVALAAQADNALIARGLGRAYGDAALQPQGVVRMERLNHCIAFDAAQGIVRAQPGVTFAELMTLFIPRGFLPPIIPGTRHATLGGAFACNVHGKNHFRMGDFAEHVLSIRLLLPSGEAVECSPENNSELFWATAGGMGMTGIIEEITLRLMPIASASLQAMTCRVANIEQMVGAFEHYRATNDYLVGWIDHMATGDAIGRGVFEAASHAPAIDGATPLGDYSAPPARLSIPFFTPGFLLNHYAMALYNRRRFAKAPEMPEPSFVDFSGFFHPLDRIGGWNRLYGKRGFLQYQCLIPETPTIAAQLREFLTMIQQHGLFSCLAVIKYHRNGRGYLTFPIQGYSIALDFPNSPAARQLLPVLDEWVAAKGGRVYLAKDALLSAALFRRMYGNAGEQWMQMIQTLDPKARFTSLMSERLQWKAGR
jgi:FAD/FMN-containing dehydrogenase